MQRYIERFVSQASFWWVTRSHDNHFIKCYASCHYTSLTVCARFDTGICICKCVFIYVTFSLWDNEEYLNVVLWWRHQMETFSALLALWAGIYRSPVNSPHKDQWRGALMFSLIWARIVGWVNNREPGDLRRHSAPYDVTVTICVLWSQMFGISDGLAADMINVAMAVCLLFEMATFLLSLKYWYPFNLPNKNTCLGFMMYDPSQHSWVMIDITIFLCYAQNTVDKHGL